MKIRGLLLAGAAFAISFYGVGADAHASVPAAPNKLKPRIEAGMKLGTERHIGVTEAWIPLAQDENSVFYGDMRFVHDNASSHEGNFGVGFRRYIPEGKVVLGTHAWIDRRKTKLGSEFFQATIGGELLTDRFEARVNGYIPLNGSKIHQGPNLGSTTAYMAGTGLFFDTASTVKEIPQGGFDAEFGKKIWTPFQDLTDSTRLYGGTYRFTGGEAKNMTGWRLRAKTDVNSWLSLGGTWQRDNIRGGQGFLEATFKFGGKASYKEQGLRARLDESPERDIDIVAGSVTTDTGLRKQVTNTNGTTTRVITVDNTAAAGGDGSAEKPFNTLLAAQNAQAANDVIYVKSGDGTSNGMNGGITIAQPGVRLIGTGADFDLGNGIVLKGTGLYPVITNPVGRGILVNASDVKISGALVEKTQSHGIDVTTNGTSLDVSGVQITNMIIRDGNARGINLVSTAGGRIYDTLVSGNLIERMLNGTGFGNGNGYGINIGGGANTFISGTTVINNTVQSTNRSGIQLIATGANSQVLNTTVLNNRISNSHYFESHTSAGGRTSGVLVENNYITAAPGHIGFSFYNDGANSRLQDTVVKNNTVVGNGTNYGISSGAYTNAVTTNFTIEGNSISDVTGASGYGIFIDSSGAGNLSNLQVFGNKITSSKHGIFINDDTAGVFDIRLENSATGLGGNSIFGNSLSDLRLDLDNGTILARGNWWGNSSGPQSGQIINEGACPACGTANTTNFLTSAP